jgi:NTE family protein
MDRRALVLGGGGVTGIAWETGLIAGLGIDLAAADVIIGTSAGSVVGTEIEVLYQDQLAPPAPEPAARIGWDFSGRLLWDVHTSRDPKRARGADRQAGAGRAHHARGRPAEGLRGPAADQRKPRRARAAAILLACRWPD